MTFTSGRSSYKSMFKDLQVLKVPNLYYIDKFSIAKIKNLYFKLRKLLSQLQNQT